MGQGIDGSSKTVNERMPPMGVAGVCGSEVALNGSVVFEGAKLFELLAPDIAAGGGEGSELGHAAQFGVQFNEFSSVAVEDAGAGANDEWKLNVPKDFGLIGAEKEF